MRRHITRSALLLTACLTLLATVAVPIASAHFTVASRSPAQGAKVKKTLKLVTITMSAQPKSGTLSVTGPGGKVSIGAGGIDPRNVKRLRVTLKSSLSAGLYTARWTGKGADGHTLSGKWTFTLID